MLMSAAQINRNNVKDKSKKRDYMKDNLKYSISEAKRASMDIIKAYLCKDETGKYVIDPKTRMPILMISPPGIGKTETAGDIARIMHIGFASFSLTHHSRNSMLGLPVIKDLPDGGKYTEFTMSDILAAVYQSVHEGHDEGILLLDEFTSTPESIMPMMLSFLQTGTIGRYKLPDGWIIVLCGNPPEFNKSARNLDPATYDRVRLMNIDVNLQAFLEYCDENEVHPAVVNFLSAFPECLYRCEKKDDGLELVTCRSWNRLAKSIECYEKAGALVDIRMIGQFIKSEEIAHLFYDYYEQFGEVDAMAELDSVYMGTFSEELVNKMSGLSVRERWKKLDYMRRVLAERYAGCLDKSAEQNKLAESLDNLVGFAMQIDDHGVVTSRFMEDVNGEESFMRAMARYPGKNYMDYCKGKYFAGEAG